jgi:trimeric autotransporter adhesin
MMFESARENLVYSKSVLMRRTASPAGWVFVATILGLLAWAGWLQEARAFSSIPNQDTWITNGTVFAIAEANSTVYLGGDFTYVGPNTGSGVPIDAASGSPVSSFPKVDGTIWAVVPDGSGGWYIGGDFSRVGGLYRNRIAHILSDGAVDIPWDASADGTVYALAVSGSTVYAGGDFSSIGSETRTYIAALDAVSGLATSWDPGADGTVYALAVSGSTVYAGGDFTFIGGGARHRIAALDAPTGYVTSWDPGADSTVYSLAVSGSRVYAGGFFTNIGGEARSYLGALDSTTGKAVSWNPGADSAVFTLAVNGSTIYAGGHFTTIGGQARNRIAALSSATDNATSWDPNADSTIYALSASGSVIYAGGFFGTIGGQTRNHLAALDGTTGSATSWNPNPDSSVYALAASSWAIYAGGDFVSIGGQTRHNLAALDTATGVATSWNPGADSTVFALVAKGSTIYAGGDFATIGGQVRNHIAALQTTSGNATSWNPDADSIVYTLALNGSTVYAGGDFAAIGGEARNFIAALDSSSGLATSWDPSADWTVWVLALSGSTVYAGGDFATIGGEARNFIAALDSSSGLATSWDPNADSTVYSLAVGGSTVYAGGDFATIGGKVRSYIAALDSITSLATSWDPSADDNVFALALGGSTVYAGGFFSSIGGQTRNFLAALDGTGNATSWNPNADYTVWALALTAQDLYAGGDFLSLAGEVRPHFVQFAAGVVISGVVTSGGSGLSGVTISLTGAATKSTTTDSSGKYRFLGLPDGAYTVSPSRTGYAFTPVSIDLNVSGADVTGQDFAATQIGYSVFGRVTSDGSGLSGVTINLTGAATKSTTTDSNGNYSFTGLPNGVYTVTPSKTGYNMAPQSRSFNINGADVTGQNFAAITYSISGTVTSGGFGLLGAAVDLTGAATKSTTTDGNGNYSFTGLSNGAYTVTPTKAGYTFTPPSISVNVNGADVGGQSFVAPLGAATLVSPSGTITSSTPAYTWNAVPGSATYYLYVNDSTGNKIGTWYSKDQAGCPGGTGTCTVSPGTGLAAGAAKWWVQTWNTNGYGPWSVGMAFTVPTPGKVTLLSPSGTISTSTPEYTWNADPLSTWYYLYADDSTGNKISSWYSASQAGCSAGTGTCTVSPGTILAPGSGKWWVQSYGSSGYGPWSDGMSFSVPPGKAALGSPSGTISTSTPDYIWNAVPGSTWYLLYADDSTGNRINTWYSASQAGCSAGTGTCTVSPGTTLAPGSARWWVQTYGSNGNGPWSEGMSFSVPPGKAVLLSPTGNISGNTPAYTWNAVPGSTWYLLYVDDSTGNRINTWYSPSQAGCSAGTGTCTVSPGSVLAPGSGIWWVQTYASNGYGPWSDGMAYAIGP